MSPHFIFIGASGAPEPTWLDHDGSLNSALYELIDPATYSGIDTLHTNPSAYFDNDLNVIIIAMYDRLFLIGEDGTGGLEVKDSTRLEYAYGIQQENSDPGNYPDHRNFCYSMGGAFTVSSAGDLYLTNVYAFREYNETYPFFFSPAYFDQLPITYSSSSISIGVPELFYQQSPAGGQPLAIDNELFTYRIDDDVVFFDYFGGDFASGTYLTGEIFVLDPYTATPSRGDPGVSISYLFDGTDGQYSRASTRMTCTNTGRAPFYQQGGYWDRGMVDVREGNWDYAVLYSFSGTSSGIYRLYVCVGTTVTNHPQYPGETKFYSKPSFELTDYFGGDAVKDHTDFILRKLSTGEYLISNGSYSVVLSLDIPTGIFTLVDSWTSTFNLYNANDYDDSVRIEHKADVELPEDQAWISRRNTHPNYWEIQSAVIKADSSGHVDDTINIVEYHDDTPIDVDLQAVPVRWAEHQAGLDEIWAIIIDDTDGKMYGQRIVK